MAGEPGARQEARAGRARQSANGRDRSADLGISNGTALGEREVGKMGRVWRVAS